MLYAMQAPQQSLAFLDQLSQAQTQDQEITDLLFLLKEGSLVSPSLIVPASTEETYYRLNNLPEQLQQLFKKVNLSDPDEDDIEDLEPHALELFKKHFLLDEFIDTFYSALTPLGSSLCVRRPETQGRTVTKGRPTLIALKNLWATHWTFEAIMQRLSETKSIAVEAQSVIIQAPSDPKLYNDDAAQNALGQAVQLAKDTQGQITRIIYPKPN